jgi:hypothetical protein
MVKGSKRMSFYVFDIEDIDKTKIMVVELERLVWDAIYALQKAGLDSEAALLRRVLTKS